MQTLYEVQRRWSHSEKDDAVLLAHTIPKWTRRLRQYRHRIGKAEDPRCLECGHTDDTTEHAVFYCPKWLEKRKRTQDEIGYTYTVGNIMEYMLTTLENWSKIKDKGCEGKGQVRSQDKEEGSDDQPIPTLK